MRRIVTAGSWYPYQKPTSLDSENIGIFDVVIPPTATGFLLFVVQASILLAPSLFALQFGAHHAGQGFPARLVLPAARHDCVARFLGGHSDADARATIVGGSVPASPAFLHGIRVPLAPFSFAQ